MDGRLLKDGSDSTDEREKLELYNSGFVSGLVRAEFLGNEGKAGVKDCRAGLAAGNAESKFGRRKCTRGSGCEAGAGRAGELSDVGEVVPRNDPPMPVSLPRL